MKSARWPGLLLAGVLLSFGPLSCGTQTTLDTSWSIPQSPSARVHKLVVLSVLKNPGESRAFESSVVSEFSRSGVRAIPGFTLIPRDSTVSREQMENLVRASGADGVLILRMLAVNDASTYVMPTAYVVTGTRHPAWWTDRYWGYYHPYPHHYWGQYYTTTQVVWARGYWEKSFTHVIESSLYHASDNRLLWTATSTTYEPQGPSDLAKSISGPILQRLRKEGFLQAK